jgi:hypothetical protein
MRRCEGTSGNEAANSGPRGTKKKGHIMTKQSTKPTHRIYAVVKRGDKNHWDDIGAAWPHKDGKGFNLKLGYLPLNGGELFIREPKPKTDGNAADASAPEADYEGGF